MKLVTVAEMRAIEKEADARGLSYAQMMEYAGKGLADSIRETYSHLEISNAVGLVGPGNNGGDTLVALAHLAQQGWRANAYLVRPRAEGDPLVARLLQAGGEVVPGSDDTAGERLSNWIEEPTVVMDGVLGTGFQLPLKPGLASALQLVKTLLEAHATVHVVAVDCPSGVDCDSGAAASEALQAELTVTMAAVKQGLLRYPAAKLVGEIKVVGIGLEEAGLQLTSWDPVRRSVLEGAEVRSLLPERSSDAHKGTFGTVLIAAGSLNYTGAALLAGEAAYRVGAGLVTLAVPEPLHAPLAGCLPEATWVLLPHDKGAISVEAAEVLLEQMGRATALLVGPGFGLAESTFSFMEAVFITERIAKLPPLVVDADGLKLLSRLPGWPDRLPAPGVLTPHPGEMAVLTGLGTGEVQGERVAIAEKYARKWGHVVVLKGAYTVVASPDGRTAVVPVASAALARAGTGDVLAGAIVGLRAQGVPAYEAACAGAWMHAQAGLRAAQALGSTTAVLAGDVLIALIEVLADI